MPAVSRIGEESPYACLWLVWLTHSICFTVWNINWVKYCPFSSWIFGSNFVPNFFLRRGPIFGPNKIPNPKRNLKKVRAYIVKAATKSFKTILFCTLCRLFYLLFPRNKLKWSVCLACYNRQFLCLWEISYWMYCRVSWICF